MAPQAHHDLMVDTTHDEHALQSYVSNLRMYILNEIGGGLSSVYEGRVKPAFEKRAGHAPKDEHDVRHAMMADPYCQTWSSMMRSCQEMIWDSIMASITVSAMILAIMAMSKMFTQLLAFTGATSELVQLVANLGYGPIVMLLIMLAVPFILCMFIDTIAVILLTIPIYQPVVNSLGFDPVWFWLLFLINITLGAITPPFGYTLFAFKAVVPNMTISDVYKATWPFVLLFLAGIAMIIMFPQIATWLPNLVG